ncbi:hypothetical protein [Pantoea cypripedii]|uniref:Peptidase n=1 Tax=Pantoea cypripedii TaxID=55209 RepID=A0A6B9G2E9_PANCY|nr:hypothetical protein [Pantoea cypripedii]QGY28217.1 hypothetical protein CUN67_04375 [Pantoea cypripedii]
MFPVNRSSSATLPSTVSSAPDDHATASAAGDQIVAVTNSALRMGSVPGQNETETPINSPSEKAQGGAVVALRPEDYEKLIYGKATGRTSSLVPFGADVVPAGDTADLFATAVTTRGRSETDDVVLYNRAPGWVFIAHPPAVGSSPAYLTSLREDFLAMVLNPDFNYRAENCLPNYGVMTTIAVPHVEEGEMCSANAHFFYLDAFRPKDVKAFLRDFFDAILSACQKVTTEDEAMAISFLMSTNYYWDQADVPPLFAGDISQGEFLSMRDQLLETDKFSELKEQMAEKAQSCEEMEELVRHIDLNDDPEV